MRRKSILGTISLIVIGIVFGAVLVSGFGFVRPSFADIQVGNSQPPVPEVKGDALAFNNQFIEVAEKVTPSIVQITCVTTSKSSNLIPEEFKFFFPFRDDVPREQQSGGSGVIISDDGYILTNNHVVENANQITVTLNDREQYEATLVGNDPLTDLAVIKINAKDLPAAYFGDSNKLKVGQWVMAIGNPLSLTSTVTAGIVSAIGRNLNLIRDSYGIEHFIQTDAAINPGNSGGALVDLNGALVGINSAIATNGMTGSYIGYGFAIPINIARTVSEDLIAHGKVHRGYIGVNIAEVDAATAKAIGLDKPKGVMVQGVVEDGAAAKEDIKPGDVILTIDELELLQPNQLQSYIASKRAGETVKLVIFREGKDIERYITLKAKDDDLQVEEANDKTGKKHNSDGNISEIEFDKIGLTVRNMTAAEYDNYKVDNGVLITNVKQYGKAYNQRIGRGLVITEIDKEKINSVVDFQNVIEKKKGNAVLLKLVDTQGNSRFVGLEIPE